MDIRIQSCPLDEIDPLRDMYRAEMNCQIIHDSIHRREGWSQELAIRDSDVLVGYASLAVRGPWLDRHALYEYFVAMPFRDRIFDYFEAVCAHIRPELIETQTNAPLLNAMLLTYASDVAPEAILFRDQVTTHHFPADTNFRKVGPADQPDLVAADLDPDAQWLVESHGSIVAAGGILYHYNRPYGDIYMSVAIPYRRQGLGSYLVQELKRVCYAGGSVPAARCNVSNTASRRTLQRAGFVPCGHLVTGKVPDRFKEEPS